MKYSALITVSAVALALAACGKNDEPTVQETPGVEGSLGAASGPAAPASAGEAFANTAAASDAFEIAISQLAAEKAASAKTKAFAQQMVKAHTASTAKLTTAAAAASPAITLTSTYNPMQQQVLDDLKAKSGAAFDTAYAKAQVDAHQATLDALKAYSATGDVPSLKAFATDRVPVVTAHLNMAKGL